MINYKNHFQERRTVLLTEVQPDPRTLYVARALGKAGHRVVVVSGDYHAVVKASRCVLCWMSI